MGRTIATFHQLIEQTRARFAPFRRALRREDQQLFDELFERAKYYAASGTMEAGAEPFEAVVLAFLLEQQKSLRALEARLHLLENADATGWMAARPLPGAGGDGPLGD